jgi:hypothetical protein
MLDDARLDELRLRGEKVRIVRDAIPENDVIGIIIAWNESDVLIRKQNRKVIKLSKRYEIQPISQPRE